MSGINYRYSYSGADAKALVYYPDLDGFIAPLESLHTVSVSVHEAKGPARALGFRGIKGFSRGIRTIAGSMVLVVVEDHPLRELTARSQDAIAAAGHNGGWSADRYITGVGTALDRFEYSNSLATLLPPFNLVMQYVSEGGQFAEVTSVNEANQDQKELRAVGASWMLEGIEVIDVGMVTSVNDTVSEITLSFMACNFRPLSRNLFGGPFSASDPRLLANIGRDVEVQHSEIWRALNPSPSVDSNGSYIPPDLMAGPSTFVF